MYVQMLTSKLREETPGRKVNAGGRSEAAGREREGRARRDMRYEIIYKLGQ